MTKEKIFYIAYRICNYLKNLNMQNQYEDYEFCMYVSDVANDIESAITNNNKGYISQYYDVLYEEYENLYNIEYSDDLIGYIDEVKELIALLNECEV